jgi:hypothetical protein
VRHKEHPTYATGGIQIQLRLVITHKLGST